MSQDRTNVREQEWAKHAPDFMVAAIEQVVGARDDIREMLGRLNEREANLTQREQVVGERENAITKAADDMKQFANQIYGPDSELAKVNLRLEELPSIKGRLDSHDRDLSELKSRVTTLEQRKTG